MSRYLRIARFDHWIKQLFMLPGAWLACVMTPANSRRTFLLLIIGLGATSLAASANYVINEWLDA